jgi:CheY-like chemotaxis protein
MRTVLVVDDDPDLLTTTSAIFEHLGYRAIVSATGEDAIAMLTNDREIAVLIADVIMPGISGIELAHQGKRLNPRIKIVLTSGHLSGLNIPDGWAFVPKPFHIADLVKALAQAN